MGTNYQCHLPSLLLPLKQQVRTEFWAALPEHPLKRALGTQFLIALPKHNKARLLGSQKSLEH
eukprot:6752454-Prorocentrum_lima.AAC.1